MLEMGLTITHFEVLQKGPLARWFSNIIGAYASRCRVAKQHLCRSTVDRPATHTAVANKNFKVSCAVLNKITCFLLHCTVNKNDVPIPEHIKLADINFNIPSKIDLLFGSDIYYDIIVPGIIKFGKNMPTLQNSYLGWVLAGPVLNNYCSSNVCVSLCSQNCNASDFMTKFWQLEEISDKQLLTSDNKQCEELFSTTTKQLSNGSFQINLPLRSPQEHLKLGDSYTPASKRFFLLENRFAKDKDIKRRKFKDEYKLEMNS
ncbi:hypothetical protein NQ318_020797 [Aromia moschata]|uniref:Peptidase aspartic putative domain-containing protein n=1 Tax=Aromia moschata TaxID=1265417 RepID=A0AAV8YB73_9CUCU|nr:hypothetical protein NQ318_020797 [Aromia moschata]